MLIEIDHHSGVPVYRQIMEKMALHIKTGGLAQGESLPSVRHLSAHLEVNPMTISKAYSFLEHEGLVERRPGKPLIVKAISEEQMQQDKLTFLMDALKEVVSLANQLSVQKMKL